MLNLVLYTMPRIPKIEEWLVGYKTLSIIITKLRGTFIRRAMRLSNIQVRLLMRVKPSEVEPEEWEDNVFKVTSIDLQQKAHEITKMNFY